jgi:hypothetical protein
MLSTDPYVTLGYTEDLGYDVVLSGLEEGWVGVAEYGGRVVGFVVFRVSTVSHSEGTSGPWL